MLPTGLGYSQGAGAGALGPAGVPGAGLSGGRAERISTSSLPCSLCPSGGRGWEGAGTAYCWGVVYGHIHPAACQATTGQGEVRGRTAG